MKTFAFCNLFQSGNIQLSFLIYIYCKLFFSLFFLFSFSETIVIWKSSWTNQQSFLSYFICVCMCVLISDLHILNLFHCICHPFLLSWMQYIFSRKILILLLLKTLPKSHLDFVNWSQSSLLWSCFKCLMDHCSWYTQNNSELLCVVFWLGG